MVRLEPSSACGWLMETSTTLPLPTTPCFQCGPVGVEGPSSPGKFSCFDTRGYLDQPCLDTSRRKKGL